MATLEAIQAKMKKLQAQAEALIAKKSQAALDRIRALMLEHGLTTADIEAKAKARRERAQVASASGVSGKTKPLSVKGKLAPKYLNPKTGETWSGRARPPAWIKDVKDRSKFLIDAASTGIDAVTVKKATPAAKKASSLARPVTGGSQPKGSQPAKYRDPKTGATWSGRGRAPAWMAAAKDRTKFLIDVAATVANVPTVASKTGKPKASAKRSMAPASRKAAGKTTGAPGVKRAAVKNAAKKRAVAVKAAATKPEVAKAPESPAVEASA